MAYNSRNLSVLAYANGFTLWHYTTPDSSVAAAGYFTPAGHMLRPGDLMMVNHDTGGTPGAGMYQVVSATPAAVAVATL